MAGSKTPGPLRIRAHVLARRREYLQERIRLSGLVRWLAQFK